MQLRRAKERSIRLQQSNIREVTSDESCTEAALLNAYFQRAKSKNYLAGEKSGKEETALPESCFRRTAVGPGKIRIPDGGIQKEHAGGKRSWQLTEACRNAVCNHLLAESGRGAGATTVGWQSREGLRQKAPETDSRPPNRIEKRRDRKSESTIRELLGLVDRDIRRTEGIVTGHPAQSRSRCQRQSMTAKRWLRPPIPLRLRYERTRRDNDPAMQRRILAGQVSVPLSGLFFWSSFICNPDGTDRGTCRKLGKQRSRPWKLKRGIRIRDRRLCPRMIEVTR